MSEPFLAEIKIVGFNFPPRNWAFCDGQILPINQNQSLYSLLGTTYGGDGRTTFGLPELRGRSPMHVGQSPFGSFHQLGQKSGEEGQHLSVAEMPAHTHTAQATSATANTDSPVSGSLLGKSPEQVYRSPSGPASMATGSITNVGGNQAHENMPPFLAVNFCIALRGLFPSRN
jgi:microcystin-dependent protein